MVKILVVDDEESILRMLSRMLSKEGYEVVTTSSGLNSLDIIKKTDIDIVFVDIMMPEINGLELLKQIKQINKNISVIMMTAYATIETTVEAIKYGAENYLLKPFDKTLLLSAIRNVLLSTKSKNYLQQQEAILEIIPILNGYVLGQINEITFLNNILEISLKLNKSQKGAIFWFDKDQNTIVPLAKKGLNVDFGKKFILDNISLERLEHLKNPQIIASEQKTNFCKNFIEQNENESLLVIPIILKDKIYGIIYIIIPKVKDEKLLDTDSVLLSFFANILTFTLSNYASTKKLVEYNKLKSEFVSRVSHDLRTPIMSISGAIELLSDLETDENKKQLVQVIQRNITRMNDLVQNLLDFSRIEVGEFKLKKGTVNFGKLVIDTIEDFRYLASTKKIIFETNIQENINAYFDPERIKQVISNLISNAIKFTPENGKITILCSYDEKNLPEAKDSLGTIKFTISDTGIGIPQEYQTKIFEKFFKASSEIDNPTGFGIGLSVVKSLVEAHNGIIELKSQPNKGTTFILYLPIYKS